MITIIRNYLPFDYDWLHEEGSGLKTPNFFNIYTVPHSTYFWSRTQYPYGRFRACHSLMYLLLTLTISRLRLVNIYLYLSGTLKFGFNNKNVNYNFISWSNCTFIHSITFSFLLDFSLLIGGGNKWIIRNK